MVPFYRVLLKLCLQLHKDKGPTMSLLVPGWKVLVLRPGIVLCSWQDTLISQSLSIWELTQLHRHINAGDIDVNLKKH